jgi:hypothetical protein
MAAFPLLKTGAIAQYPFGRGQRFRTEVIQFGDGAEQRYRDFKAGLREWVIGLDLLTDQEVAAIESFYWANGGASAVFTFTDPFDNEEHLSCEFDETVRLAFEGETRGTTEIVVRQRR